MEHNQEDEVQSTDTKSPAAHTGSGRAGRQFADPQSRRVFLRNAVLTSVAAAGAGVAGAAVVEASPKILQRLAGTGNTPSGHDPFMMCFEDSGFIMTGSFTVHENGKTSPGTFFLWFTAYDIPPDTYTISITPTLSDSSKPFQYENTHNGNNAFIFESAANTAVDCPSANPANQVKQGHGLANVFPFKVTGTSHVDLQLKVHIAWSGGPISSSESFTFVGTISSSTNPSLGSAQISVTANPG